MAVEDICKQAYSLANCSIDQNYKFLHPNLYCIVLNYFNFNNSLAISCSNFSVLYHFTSCYISFKYIFIFTDTSQLFPVPQFQRVCMRLRLTQLDNQIRSKFFLLLFLFWVPLIGFNLKLMFQYSIEVKWRRQIHRERHIGRENEKLFFK